jgi:hypothetical protein
MMRAGFVEMQLIPRAADRAPSRSFFTWRVDVQACFRRMAGEAGGAQWGDCAGHCFRRRALSSGAGRPFPFDASGDRTLALP